MQSFVLPLCDSFIESNNFYLTCLDRMRHTNDDDAGALVFACAYASALPALACLSIVPCAERMRVRAFRLPASNNTNTHARTQRRAIELVASWQMHSALMRLRLTEITVSFRARARARMSPAGRRRRRRRQQQPKLHGCLTGPVCLPGDRCASFGFGLCCCRAVVGIVVVCMRIHPHLTRYAHALARMFVSSIVTPPLRTAVPAAVNS